MFPELFGFPELFRNLPAGGRDLCWVTVATRLCLRNVKPHTIVSHLSVDHHNGNEIGDDDDDSKCNDGGNNDDNDTCKSNDEEPWVKTQKPD